MGDSSFGRLIAAAAIVVFIAGCGAASQSTSPSMSSQDAPRHSSSEGLIYGFGYGTGVILDYPSGRRVSNFSTGVIDAASCADDQGNTFLGAIGSSSGSTTDIMLKYPYGATTPSASESLGFTPISCSVDNTTGNVAVAVHSPYWAVEILPNFSGPGTIYRAPNGSFYQCVGYDGSGNLFVLGTTTHYSYFLAEMPKTSTSFSQISLNLGVKVGYIRSIQWDGSYMTLEASVKKAGAKPKEYPQEIFRISVAGSKATVVGTTTFNQLKGERSGSSWIQANLGIFVFALPHVTVWNYPAGGKAILNLKTKAIGGPIDLATVVTSSSR